MTSLFELAVHSREDGCYRPLPPPEPRSSLATGDALLGPWPASHLIRTSYGVGLAHVDALRRLTAAGEIDATSPWTLLRGALENFATGICSKGQVRDGAGGLESVQAPGYWPG